VLYGGTSRVERKGFPFGEKMFHCPTAEASSRQGWGVQVRLKN
jgi:hypothetical protein